MSCVCAAGRCRTRPTALGWCLYLVGNAVCLLRGPNSCGRDLEAHLAALGKEYVGGLLCVGLELSLHGLDVVVGLCLKLGGGRSAGTARRQDSAIELLLLLTPVRINEGLGIDPVVVDVEL